MKKATKQKTPEFALGIDWETTGAQWGDNAASAERFQGISFCAIVIRTEDFSIVKKASAFIKFDPSYEWTEGAAGVHGLTKEFLEQNGVTQEEAVMMLGELIIEHFGTTEVMFLGHNVDFDIAFTRHLFKKFGIELKVNHVKMDTSGAFFIGMRLHKSDLIFDKLQINTREDNKGHSAEDDIMMTLEACKILRALVTVGAESCGLTLGASA